MGSSPGPISGSCVCTGHETQLVEVNRCGVVIPHKGSLHCKPELFCREYTGKTRLQSRTSNTLSL